jgi:hypothetical protein
MLKLSNKSDDIVLIDYANARKYKRKSGAYIVAPENQIYNDN